MRLLQFYYSLEEEEEEQEKMKIAQLVIFLALIQVASTRAKTQSNNELTTGTVVPSPSPWPEKFHALLYMNLTDGRLQITNLWYDWTKGRNVNIIQKQLGKLLYDVEWNNGTSFYYTLGAQRECQTLYFEVGIPRPGWLDGATYLGMEYTDGFMCNVWEKVDFIWYYEDVITKVPVRWDFYDGISTHVITYEVGKELEDSLVQAPAYCFS
ncbi:hypothetical protein BVC80_1837g159 [Macleaya cordata]|uniref:Transferase n=1 Tax=Macleaya cordata TaxID=56857 RepID=A0A200R3Q3_MACCD|nr:hypothetical protein BVC80_1837g159 [Macleaya cordata]